MSILIKGMEMPKNCGECPFKGLNPTGESMICDLTLFSVPWDWIPFDCPLIEISTPHGRLIDAEKLRAEFPHPDDWRKPETAYAHLSGIWATIDCAETIIGEEDET